MDIIERLRLKNSNLDDEAADTIEALRRERDRLKAACDKFSEDELLLTQQPRIKQLLEAGDAVVKRWETPLWKDVPATANYIYALRDALAAI